MKSSSSQIETIADRYRITGTLGQGNSCITYAALDLHTQQPVALKALSLRHLSDWKALELFEREARILAQLDHPAIPRYLNFFQAESENDRSFYLVQQLAPGKSLAQLVQLGWQPDEDRVKQLAKTFLPILVYLQSLTPPVIHRDIKPHNILLNSKGQLFLVDFGSVQDAYRHTVMGGSTIVGTFGYMAPEQFRGQAVLSTDLYGLGTTLLFLLTGKSPADLPQRKLKLQFRDRVYLSPTFARWLERLIEPSKSDRFQDAAEALAVLQGSLTMPAKTIIRRDRPPKTAIKLVETDQQLVIRLPPEAPRNLNTWLLKLFLPILLYGFPIISLLWLMLNCFGVYLGLPFDFPDNSPMWLSWVIRKCLDIIYFLIDMEESISFTPPFPARFTRLLYSPWLIVTQIACLFVIGQAIFFPLFKVLWRDVFGRRLVITPKKITSYLSFLEILPWLWAKTEYSWSKTENVDPLCLSSMKLSPWLDFRATVITLKARTKGSSKDIDYQFGLLLTQAEKEWLVGEIHAFLDRTQHR